MTTESTRQLPVPTAELVSGLLRDGIDVRLRVSGWSMKPLVPTGSLVQFSSRPRPTVGDIVLVLHPNATLVAHRIIEMKGEWVRTKGDACAATDGAVSANQIVGSAVRLVGPVSLPLCNSWMRRIGLVLSFLYPRLVALYRGLLPRARPVGSARSIS